MTAALFPTAAASYRAPRPGRLARFIDALMAARMREAEHLVGRYRPLVHETALINGEYRKISFAETDKLPFNA